MKIRHIKIENFRGIKLLDSKLDGNFICLIGHGDNCKSTFLSAIEFTLSSRWNLNFDDSDFFNQNVENPISITITLCEWNSTDLNIKKFFTEAKFGQFIGGIDTNGPTPEPIHPEELQSITINLKVEKDLEPKWLVLKGTESKPISSGERGIFGLGRIDTYLDNNFTWSKNSLLTRLSTGTNDNLHSILNDIARNVRDIEHNLENCDATATTVKTESNKFGVRLNTLKPKVDIQKISLASGSLALHQENVPLRSLGTGSKKLISCSMQMKINDGNSITLIDELELGLEPHRIRGLIKNLKNTNQQVITTSHSPVVLRELIVANNELYVCHRLREGTQAGLLEVKSLSTVPNSQGPLRSNAEAFLGKKIIVCEGVTEVGILRALDELCSVGPNIPVWTLNTAYFNAGGIGNVKREAIALKKLGYEVSIFCDDDTPTAFTPTDVTELNALNIKTFIWETGNSVEKQLLKNLKWDKLEELLNSVESINPQKPKTVTIGEVRLRDTTLTTDITTWIESPALRNNIALAAGAGTPWFKRMDQAEVVFKTCIPNLMNGSAMETRFTEIWTWIQNA